MSEYRKIQWKEGWFAVRRNWFDFCKAYALTNLEKDVFMYLLMLRNAKQSTAKEFVTLKIKPQSIAERTGRHLRRVQQALQKFRELHLITEIRPGIYRVRTSETDSI